MSTSLRWEALYSWLAGGERTRMRISPQSRRAQVSAQSTSIEACPRRAEMEGEIRNAPLAASGQGSDTWATDGCRTHTPNLLRAVPAACVPTAGRAAQEVDEGQPRAKIMRGNLHRACRARRSSGKASRLGNAAMPAVGVNARRRAHPTGYDGVHQRGLCHHNEDDT